MTNRVLLLALTILGTTLLRSNADTYFYFTSSPLSYIGQGQTLTMMDNVYANNWNNKSVQFGAGGYQLTIAGPGLTLPSVGYYANATRWPVSGSHPGMWFMGPGRGDNSISGYFNVLQADYDSSGQISAFAVDFMQYDETNPYWWNQGSVRYNSSVAGPVVVPEPGIAAFGCLYLLCLRYGYPFIPHRHRPRAELQPAHELQIETL